MVRAMAQRSTVLVCVLCICVLSQMLGAPVTLLAAGDTSDEFSESVLEGFSLPRMPPPLTLSSDSLSAVGLPQSAHFLVLVSEQFHPPAK